jgi:hypothetical protein
MKNHPGCDACTALTREQINADDGVARHNIRTNLASVPRLIDGALHHTDEGHWQASLSYFDEIIREFEGARRLARACAGAKTTPLNPIDIAQAVLDEHVIHDEWQRSGEQIRGLLIEAVELTRKADA